jgi:hypothetical protein
MTMSNIGQWDAVERVAVGHHVQLHRLVDSPPPAGSADWLPIARDLVASLVERGGNWLVTVPAGSVPGVGRDLPSSEELFHTVEVSDVTEPPAVYRAGDRLEPNTWEGEYHARKRIVAPGVTETVSFARACNEPADEPGYSAEVSYEVRGLPR